MIAGTLDKEGFAAWLVDKCVERPSLELRDFFANVAPQTFTDRFVGLLPRETGATAAEFLKRAEEASAAIPLILLLAHHQTRAREKGDKNEEDRFTFLAAGLMTLHALAEDMGYEW